MSDGVTFPIGMDEEHREALEDPPEFSEEQLVYLEAVLAYECCHMTGMHDPQHWREDGTVCWQEMHKPYKRILEELDLDAPVVSSDGCSWCNDTFEGEEAPYSEEHPTYNPERGISDPAIGQ